MKFDECKNKTKGSTIIHERKLPTQLMFQISGYKAIDDAKENSRSILNKGKCSLQIDLILNIIFQGVNMKYILCGIWVYNPLNEINDDVGHYSTMNIDLNTGSWTGIDDGKVRLISSFPFMNEIPKLVDKKHLITMFYYRYNVCAVTYIQN